MTHAEILRTAHAETRKLKTGSFSFLSYAAIFALRLKEAYRIQRMAKGAKRIQEMAKAGKFEPTVRDLQRGNSGDSW
jgi:hypothetical protein